MSSTRLILLTLILYWIALFIGTHIPLSHEYLRADDDIVDKFLHLFAFAGLTLLFFFTVARGRQFSVRQNAPWLMSLAIYGIFDEITQPLAGRSCELFDWIADIAGIILGLFIILIYQRFMKKDQLSSSLDHSS